MARSDLSSLGPFIGPSCVAGILPLCVVGGADVLFGPWSDDTDAVYYLQAVLGPPPIALLFVSHLGRRAVWLAVGGVFVALLVILVLLITAAALLSAGES